jgi:hypothetical protein
MASDFKEKLKGLSFPRKLGGTEKKPVINDDDGTVGGYHTVRWDGSQDANVIPRAVTAKAKEGNQ